MTDTPELEILTDFHTHTVACTHAYSTIQENAAAAKARGLEAIAVTDHSPATPDGPHLWHFLNLKALPRQIDGVYILKGVEVNITDENGSLDMSDNIFEKLEIVGASIHSHCYQSNQSDDVTNAYLGTLSNKYVDFICHSGHPRYPYDYETVIKAARDNHQLIEINASTFRNRKQNIENCTNIALCCKRLGAGICVNSDSHVSMSVGDYDIVIQMLKSIDFPPELIINRNLKSFIDYIRPRKELIFE